MSFKSNRPPLDTIFTIHNLQCSKKNKNKTKNIRKKNKGNNWRERNCIIKVYLQVKNKIKYGTPWTKHLLHKIMEYTNIQHQ